jgi:hypothetical protein
MSQITIIIRKKKEVYYPLFTILISFILYWLVSLIINKANSKEVLPFILITLNILSFKISYDLFKLENKKWELEKKENEESTHYKRKNRVFLSFFMSFLIFLLIILELIILLLSDILYIISIGIHLITIVIIYFFLNWKIKKYYLLKNKEMSEPKNTLA